MNTLAMRLCGVSLPFLFALPLTPRSSLFLPLLLMLLPSPAVAQHFPADEELELMLRYNVEDAEVPGIVLGVLEADGSTRIVSYGSGGPDTRPLGPRSLFEIGSITKTFTATLLADMVARGEVALEDPVSEYLPDHVTVPHRGGREITLLDLATHTSGLPDVAAGSTTADPQDAFGDYTIEMLYAFLSDHELRRDPGSRFEYSNRGFQLLGHALARAAGTSYTDLVRRRILDPLGMDETGFPLEGESDAWMTRGHRGGNVVPHAGGTEARWGAGGLRSNAREMLEYLKANIGPPETELQRAMRTAHEVRVSVGGEGAAVGLAWQTLTIAGRPVVLHQGGMNGFSARMAFDPEKRIGTVLLTNTRGFTDNVATDLLHFGLPPAEWAAPADASALQDYPGAYAGTSGTVHVRREDEGYLTYQPTRNVRTRLYARSDSSFYMLRGPWSLTFQRDEAGEVVGMQMVVDEREAAERRQELTFRRVAEESPPPRVVALGNVSSLTFPWELGMRIAVGAVILFALLALIPRAMRKFS